MDVRSWLKLWRQHYGAIPENVLIVDLETTGLSPHEDLILQIGYCEIKDGQIVANQGIVLDWTRHAAMDQDWLCRRMQDTGNRIRSQGKEYPWTMEVLSKGSLPLYTLADCLTRLEKRDSISIGGHNIINFDIPFLSAHFHRFLNRSFIFPENAVFDTGAIEKAHQLDMSPRKGESMVDFEHRVVSLKAKGILWSLDRHCLPKYNLVKRYNLDVSQQHTAGFDARCCALLLNEFRTLSNPITCEGVSG